MNSHALSKAGKNSLRNYISDKYVFETVLIYCDFPECDNALQVSSEGVPGRGRTHPAHQSASHHRHKEVFDSL